MRIYFILVIFINICTVNAIDSTSLKDVITSKGVGSINLLKDISSVQLETYRQGCAGNLIFAVDVNEAASGTEKASSQGITIKTLSLDIIFSDYSTKSFTLFHTQT